MKPTCSGCHGYTYFRDTNRMECSYILIGNDFIPDCICGDCLLKSICTIRCQALRTLIKSVNDHGYVFRVLD